MLSLRRFLLDIYPPRGPHPSPLDEGAVTEPEGGRVDAQSFAE